MPDKYGPEKIEVLDAIEAIRRRPGMYVGDVHGGWGLHQMLWDVLANSVGEHLEGHASKLRVSVEDDLAEVEDDGRGIPVDVHPKLRRPALEHILTSLRLGRPRNQGRPRVPIASSFQGVGLAPVTALSEELEVEVRREGYAWRQRYARGRPLAPLERGERTDRTGTRIRFRPDPRIFTSRTCFDRASIRARLVRLARFNPLLAIELMSEPLHEPKGMVGWIDDMAAAREVGASDVFVTRGVVGDVAVEAALAWTDADDRALVSFCGQQETPAGGTHERGFWDGVVGAIGGQPACAALLGSPRDALGPGLLGVVHVGLSDPWFSGGTRERLASPEAADAVSALLLRDLPAYLAERPELARRLRERATR